MPLLIFIAFGCVCSDTGNFNSTQRAPFPEHEPISASTPAREPVIDIPALVNKSAKEVDAALGKPVEVDKIRESHPTDAPGEYRNYDLVGSPRTSTGTGIMVRFYKNRAVLFIVDLPHPTGTAAEALALTGIDVGSKAPFHKSPLAQQWRGEFNGRFFKEVSASIVGSSGKFDVVKAQMYQ